jgi:hypothetical protein
MEPQFIFFWKLTFWGFKNFENKILDVANDVFYGCAKSQYEIVCNSAYIKMRNDDQLWGFWILHCSQSQIWIFVFFTQPKIHNIFGWFFAHRYKSWLSKCIIFLRFFWNFKISVSDKFKNQAPWCPGAKMTYSSPVIGSDITGVFGSPFLSPNSSLICYPFLSVPT